MVIERVRDEEHSIIDVIHIKTVEEIKSIILPEDEIDNIEIESVKQELEEDYPDYSLVFACKNKHYTEMKGLGLVQKYTARGVRYFCQ